MGEKMFYDTEHDCTISLSQLENEYNELKSANDTEADTFEDYLKNCLSKNGTLEAL